MLITSTGTLVRTPAADVATMGRNTQGVRLIRLDEADRLVGISRVERLPDDEGGPSRWRPGRWRSTRWCAG